MKSKKNYDKDLKDAVIISNYHYGNQEKAGSRTIKMLIENDGGKRINKKKILRIKIKYNLKTKIRKSNTSSKNQARIQQENKVFPNILARNFERSRPDEVYVTDITQLNYGRSKKAFLAVFKDLCTKEIISYELSKRSDIQLVDIALEKAIKRLSNEAKSKLMIHSDQGFQFTSKIYSEKLKKFGITQSMSRRGNCYDNASVESFFGHFKDWLEIDRCETFEKLNEIVKREMNFYNNIRPQWSLNKKPPRLYRGFVLNNLRLF